MREEIRVAQEETAAEKARSEAALKKAQMEYDAMRNSLRHELEICHSQLLECRRELSNAQAKLAAVLEREDALKAEIVAAKMAFDDMKTTLTGKLKHCEARILKLEAEIRMTEENDAMGPLAHSKKVFCVGCQQFLVAGPDQRKAPGRLPRAGSAGPSLRPKPRGQGFTQQWVH